MMKRNNVEIEDFLQDEEFVQWVKKPTVDGNKYWKAWMEANPDKISIMLKARELLLAMTFSKKTPKTGDKEEILGNIIKKSGDKYEGRPIKVKKSLDMKFMSVAASLVLLISLAFYFAYRENRVPAEEKIIEAQSITIKETPPGIKLQTVLPDGSRVWLNADSKVSYDQFYGQETRKIKLVGEAFFEVEKDSDHPFIVQSGNLKITALGTSFNVKSLSGAKSSEVALVTGKVEVVNEGAENEKVILNPGQKAIHKEELPQLLTADFSIDNVIGWKNGIMVFDNACFHEIQETLERWYGIKIHSNLPKADEWSYTGKFDNQSLELVLKRLAFIKGFRFRIEGNKVYLFN